MPAPPCDSSDEDLPPPSSLFSPAPARASTASRPRPPVDAPARRSSPRNKPSPTAVQPTRAPSPAPTATAPRRPSTLIASSSNTPAHASPAPASRATSAGLDDEALEERERHRRLADELFPPSPPRAPPALAHAPSTSPSISSSTASLGQPAHRAPVRDVSPDHVSDSEVERSAAAVTAGPGPAVKAARRAHKGRRTSSVMYGLSDSSEDEGDLAARMHDLGLSTRPSISTKTAAPTLPTRTDPPSSRSATMPKPTKTPRARRRITISVASSSSSSSSSSEDDYLPSPSRAPAETPRPGARTTGQDSWREEQEEEIIAACTDDEDVEVSARRLPEDVEEFDGVLVYDPTPKKRPVKVATSRGTALSPMPSSSRAGTATPSRTGGGEGKKVGLGRSSLRTEVDPAASSSDEDLPPPPFKTRLDPSTSTQRTPARAPRLPAPPKPTPRPRADAKSSSSASSTATLTAAQRSALPIALIRELDRSVFRCTWNGTRRTSESGGKGLPDGIEVVWNKRLRNTAGRASWKSIRTTLPSPTAGSPPIRKQTHHALVELSTHVTDTADKLKHTLAHELCHLAAWALSGEMKPPHGAAFKLWANRVMLVRPDIEVTTTHSYEIKYRFRWQCLSAVCGKIFGRHSNSINPATYGCPCGSRLVALDKDGKVKSALGESGSSSAAGRDGATVETPRKKTKWQEFMVTESPRVRAEHPGVPQSEVLKLVAERWRLAKAVAASSTSSSTTSTSEPARPPVAVEDSLAALSLS
ncbi:hypothetical protein JCM8208_005757 [Rhodotorula glutinis]